MRSSTILCVLGAALAAAGPVHNHKELHKKAIEWDVVTETEWVTVTAGVKPTGPVFVEQTVVVEAIQATAKPNTTTTHHTSTHHTTSTPPPPPPPPKTTSTPPPPPPTTSAAPPPPPPAPKTSSVEPIIIISLPTPTPSPSPVASPPAPVGGSVQSAALYYHNLHRANHSASAVTWSSELAEYAANTASTCKFAHDMNQGSGGYGQNIDAAGYSNPVQGWSESAVVAYAITDGWYYGEVNNFASFYGEPSPPMSGPEYLHFTQIVWKGTTTIGCAAQYCPYGTVLAGSYGWFTVCNYGPEGNMEGSFNSNVAKPGDHAAVNVPYPS